MKVYIKMEKAVKKFGDSDIEKPKFHQYKRPISIKNIDNNKIVVSNKVSFGKIGLKYFIGYKDSKKIRPLCKFLPEMGACRRDFDETKYISFFTIDDELIENIMKFGKKLKIVLKKKLIDSVFTTSKNYCPQMFLEECKYIAKEREMPEYITDEVEISSGSDRKILMKQIPMK